MWKGRMVYHYHVNINDDLSCKWTELNFYFFLDGIL